MAKTLKYSKYVPKHLQEQYETSVSDPELLSLKHEISILDARLGQLIEKAEQTIDTDLLERLQKTYDNANVNLRAGNNKQFLADFVRLGDLIKDNNIGERQWRDITNTMDARRRMAQAEHKRKIELGTMLSATQAMTLVFVISSVINDKITDDTVKKEIADTLNTRLRLDFPNLFEK